MAIFKLGKQEEKPLYNNNHVESLREKVGQTAEAEKERIKKLEEVRKTVIEEISQEENTASATIGPVAGVTAPTIRRQKQIESVLAAGLEDIYFSLTPERQKQFKEAGEKTASRINNLLARAKVNIGTIVKLIRKWLSLIPGINKYFLEQEAKIKADEIMKMKEEIKA